MSRLGCAEKPVNFLTLVEGKCFMCISSPTATWLAAAAALMLNPFPQKIAQQINPAFVIFLAKVSNR